MYAVSSSLHPSPDTPFLVTTGVVQAVVASGGTAHSYSRSTVRTLHKARVVPPTTDDYRFSRAGQDGMPLPGMSRSLAEKLTTVPLSADGCVSLGMRADGDGTLFRHNYQMAERP